MRKKITLGITSVLYGSLMLSEFLFHLVSLPFCVVLYVVRISLSLGLTSVLYGFPCCPSFYVTWNHFHSVQVSMFSNFPVTWSHCRFVWVSMLSEFLCHLVSLPFCIGLLCCQILCTCLCCPRFYVTWSHFRCTRVSMLSEFLSRVVSHPLCMGSCVVRDSMYFGLSSVLYVCLLCCQSFYVTWSHFRSVQSLC